MIGGIAASVADRLVRLAKEQRRDHSFVLARYGIERLLWRLSQMPFVDEFIVKGATLFLLWRGDQTRPTRDLDLLGKGSPDPGRLIGMFRSLCVLDAESVDGLVFDPDSIVASRIKEEEEYEGVRLRLRALLGRTRIDIQIDIGFGDAVTPPATKSVFPTLLDQPAPNVLVYPAATVIAEKLQAIVDLGMRTSRMKDFYDLLLLLETDATSSALLEEAIAATFARRRTPIPTGIPLGLSDEFAQDLGKQKQWKAFQNRLKLEDERTLAEVISSLQIKVLPILAAILQRNTG
jgi:predicted nucleotidyltransferase component of viral defense system